MKYLAGNWRESEMDATEDNDATEDSDATVAPDEEPQGTVVSHSPVLSLPTLQAWLRRV